MVLHSIVTLRWHALTLRWHALTLHVILQNCRIVAENFVLHMHSGIPGKSCVCSSFFVLLSLTVTRTLLVFALAGGPECYFLTLFLSLGFLLQDKCTAERSGSKRSSNSSGPHSACPQSCSCILCLLARRNWIGFSFTSKRFGQQWKEFESYRLWR